MRQFELQYKNDLFDYIAELIVLIEREGFHKGILVKTSDIPVEQKVKDACRWCDSFNNCYSCPPYSWRIGTTRRIIGGYELGVMFVLRIKDIPPRLMKIPLIAFLLQLLFVKKYVRKLHRMVLRLEETAERDGYKTQGFIAGPCLLHSRKCSGLDKSKCKLPQLRRSSMESTGINVYKLARLYGIKIDKKLEDTIHLIGLLLIKELTEHKSIVQATELRLEEEYPIKTNCLSDIYEKKCVERIQKKLGKKYKGGTLFIALNKENLWNENKGIELNKLIDVIEENGYEIIYYGFINSRRFNSRKVTKEGNSILLLRIPIIACFIRLYLIISSTSEFLFESREYARKIYVFGRKREDRTDYRDK